MTQMEQELDDHKIRGGGSGNSTLFTVVSEGGGLSQKGHTPSSPH